MEVAGARVVEVADEGIGGRVLEVIGNAAVAAGAAAAAEVAEGDGGGGWEEGREWWR